MTSPSVFNAVQLREPVLPMKLVTANLALSFTTNVVATMLIAYKLWWVEHSLQIPLKMTSSIQLGHTENREESRPLGHCLLCRKFS